MRRKFRLGLTANKDKDRLIHVQRTYLWVGDNMQCFGVLDSPSQMRQLALSILDALKKKTEEA